MSDRNWLSTSEEVSTMIVPYEPVLRQQCACRDFLAPANEKGVPERILVMPRAQLKALLLDVTFSRPDREGR